MDGETVYVAGIGSAAAITLAGNSAITDANPSVDAASLIDSLVPGQSGPGSTVVNATGDFVNEGTILAGGPNGSTFGLNLQPIITGTTGVPGYFINYGPIIADAGNTLTIAAGPYSELFNAGLIVADGGTVIITARASAVAGGLAPARGYAIIEGGGTLETASAYAATVSGTSPVYLFADATAGNTLKIDNILSFGGRISGFQQETPSTSARPLRSEPWRSAPQARS